jgi:hypothetical protein
MKEEVRELVQDAFNNLSGNQLMGICRIAVAISNTQTKPFEELTVHEQAAVTTLHVLVKYLTEIGVLEDVQVHH